jgi:hypothetical protein
VLGTLVGGDVVGLAVDGDAVGRPYELDGGVVGRP